MIYAAVGSMDSQTARIHANLYASNCENSRAITRGIFYYSMILVSSANRHGQDLAVFNDRLVKLLSDGNQFRIVRWFDEITTNDIVR